MLTVSILADSMSLDGFRITSFYLKYPRFIHSELLTHRTFARNSSSSRAIPTMKFISRVITDPAYPMHWGKLQKGMQASEEVSGVIRMFSKAIWRGCSLMAASFAFALYVLGVHKQVVNRILEPFLWMETVVTSEQLGLENFFAQRCAPGAQPEMQALAREMRKQWNTSVPELLADGEWHQPYGDKHTLKEVSVARAARVSYTNFFGNYSEEEDMRLFKYLRRQGHWSPFEHVATPGEGQGCLPGWVTLRETLEGDH